MSDTPNHDDHWRRLAAELGLEVGPEPEQPHAAPAPRDEVVPAPEPPQQMREPAPEPPSGRGRRRRPAEAPTSEFGEGLGGADESPTWSRPERPAPPADEPKAEPSFDWSAAAESVEAEIEGSDVEAAAVPEVNPEAAEEAGEEVADEKTGKHRRRRRSRRKKDGVAPAAGEHDDTTDRPAGESATEPAEDDDGPAEDVSGWNVPSWDELIASLHRPDR